VNDTTRPVPAVSLRVPTEEDARAWHRVFDDPDVMEFHGGTADLPSYEELVARQRAHAAERGFCFWTMLDRGGAEGGEVIGFTGAQPWPHPTFGPVGEIEIGRRPARPYWGRGYVTAAARMTLERVRTAGIGSVVAMVDARNARSVAVTRRLGMELERTFPLSAPEREAYCFRLHL